MNLFENIDEESGDKEIFPKEKFGIFKDFYCFMSLGVIKDKAITNFLLHSLLSIEQCIYQTMLENKQIRIKFDKKSKKYTVSLNIIEEDSLNDALLKVKEICYRTTSNYILNYCD